MSKVVGTVDPACLKKHVKIWCSGAAGLQTLEETLEFYWGNHSLCVYYKWTIAVSFFSSLCLWYFVAAINILTGNLNEYILYNNCPTWLAAVSFEGTLKVIHWFIFSWYCMKTILLYSFILFCFKVDQLLCKDKQYSFKTVGGGSSVLEWKKGLLLKCEGFFKSNIAKMGILMKRRWMRVIYL